MKRRDLIKYLDSKGCYFKRHGANHDLYFNSINGKCSAVPRHNEIKESLCALIFKQLEIR